MMKYKRIWLLIFNFKEYVVVNRNIYLYNWEHSCWICIGFLSPAVPVKDPIQTQAVNRLQEIAHFIATFLNGKKKNESVP